MAAYFGYFVVSVDMLVHFIFLFLFWRMIAGNFPLPFIRTPNVNFGKTISTTNPTRKSEAIVKYFSKTYD